LIDNAPPIALRDVAAIVVEGHRLSLRAEVEHRLAEFGGVARTVGVDRPARLPGDDVRAELSRAMDRVFDRADLFTFMP